MNKSFKVVFSKARSALMVVNEATSSIQAKGTKTVIAAAAAAMLAGGAMAAIPKGAVEITDSQAMTTPAGETAADHASLVVRPSVTETFYYSELSYGASAKVDGVTLSYMAQGKDDAGNQLSNHFRIIGGTISGFEVKHAANGTGGSVFEAIADATTTDGLGLNGIDLLVDGTINIAIIY